MASGALRSPAGASLPLEKPCFVLRKFEPPGAFPALRISPRKLIDPLPQLVLPRLMPHFRDLTPAEQLNHLTELALADFHSILAVPLHARPQAELEMWLRAKVRAGAYVLAAKLRVDEASLRKRELDALPRLLKQIEQAKAADPSLDL